MGHRHIDCTTGLLAAEASEAGVPASLVDELIERAHREIRSGLLPSCQLALAHNG